MPSIDVLVEDQNLIQAEMRFSNQCEVGVVLPSNERRNDGSRVVLPSNAFSPFVGASAGTEVKAVPEGRYYPLASSDEGFTAEAPRIDARAMSPAFLTHWDLDAVEEGAWSRTELGTEIAVIELANCHVSHTRPSQVLYLGDKGGSTVGECVRRVMAEVMKSYLGQLFDMNGAERHRKTGFRTTKVYTVV